MPEWLQQLGTLLEPYLPAIAVVGAVMVLASMLVIPWLILRMPATYFVREYRPRHWTAFTASWWLLRNLLALVLFAAGFLMLFLPGQGLLTILISLVVSDFPGKYQLEKAVIRQDAVFKAVNWIRHRYGREAIIHPDH
ncbi:hypothetical protein PVT67_02970 [Gallaecimonas kandeliae]|uniref:hypothetical protein n=1 Tax=Gallaecimonas kandeliae TaxID=3029055 RepID=UPI0026492C29|nr:hypothetical protein [Gallaecimonas kandeliae]WKE66225.1 hypothetical protein PVT67_02970 [Gallaecimonas kandeliae]